MATPNPVQMQKYLSGVDYPCGRDQLVEHAKKQGAENDIIEYLQQLPDRNYDGPNAVSQEFART
ncbi:DUF2795 domain-containing protein [Amycolatopsis sp. K13G38]|uniref:DUF2795 domain-containing protein n=1 Tax=Amycolatopsis acididurans TaxID=2724524 RepID=A0ABX1JIA6_9PSEU|nr:DUF2795 domain-containing protein [Amycolatopsis acididurans]NKQ58569.1 DUF2795 domain-containing protein [Amycolatopsis acididurans]